VFFKWDSEDWTKWILPYVTYSPGGAVHYTLFVNAREYAINSMLGVFVFITEEASTTTSSTTTTPSSGPSDPQLALPASFGIMGFSVYLGVLLGIFILPHLRDGR